MGSKFLSELAESNVKLRRSRYASEIANSVENSKRYTLSDVRANKIDIEVLKERDKCAFVDVADKGIRYHLVVMLKHMVERNAKTAVLNPGCYLYPGGGYIDGGSGYEETICGNSTLYEVLRDSSDYYDWNNNHLNNWLYTNVCLYTPDIVVCDNNQKGIGFIDVITCSPPDYNKVSTKRANNAVKDRIELIFNTAVRNNVRHLILCDFGCENPKCDTEFIANAFHDMTIIHSSRFDTITYVMDYSKDSEIFKRVFNV